LELLTLRDAADAVAFVSEIRAKQIDDAPSEELRKRWQERAAELSPIERSTLATRLERLSSPAKKRLREWATHEGLPLPRPEELADPVTAIEGARRLTSILAYGNMLRQELKPILWVPTVRRGRPVQEAARELVMLLADDYRRAAGREPERAVDTRAPGPFVRMVAEVLRLAGTPHVDAVELVAWYGSLRRRGTRV